MTPTITPEAARLAEELLPCPFCGSTKLKIYMNAPSSDQTAWPHVACLDCGCGQSSVAKWNRRPAKQDAAPTSAATGKRDLQVATSASTVPAGFWLAPMHLDGEMTLAFDRSRPGATRHWQAMRESWIARNPGACSVTDGEAKK